MLMQTIKHSHVHNWKGEKKFVLQRFRMNEFEKTRSAVRNRMRYPLANFYASHIAFYEGMRSMHNSSSTFFNTFQSLKAAGWHGNVPGLVCSMNSLTALALCQRDLQRMPVKFRSKYISLTKREVKMAGYWRSSLFAFLWTETTSGP